MMDVAVETVTPADAAAFLLNNVNNRNVRERTVRQYAADMKAGRWRLNGEAIKFNDSGALLDGQHRCLACVEAQTPFETLIAYDLSDDDKVTFDSGVRRNFSDILKFAGERYTMELASTVRACWIYENYPNPLTVTYPPSHQQMKIWLDENPDVRAAVDVARAVRRNIALPTSSIALPFLHANRIDPEDAADFFEKLRTGIDLQNGSPALALRRYAELLRPKRAKPPTPYITALVIKAFNLYRLGAEIEQVHWRGGGRAAEPYPRIKADPALADVA